jgi:hypothetical protein
MSNFFCVDLCYFTRVCNLLLALLCMPFTSVCSWLMGAFYYCSRFTRPPTCVQFTFSHQSVPSLTPVVTIIIWPKLNRMHGWTHALKNPENVACIKTKKTKFRVSGSLFSPAIFYLVPNSRQTGYAICATFSINRAQSYACVVSHAYAFRYTLDMHWFHINRIAQIQCISCVQRKTSEDVCPILCIWIWFFFSNTLDWGYDSILMKRSTITCG